MYKLGGQIYKHVLALIMKTKKIGGQIYDQISFPITHHCKYGVAI